jgi:hypothetical protein
VNLFKLHTGRQYVTDVLGYIVTSLHFKKYPAVAQPYYHPPPTWFHCTFRPSESERTSDLMWSVGWQSSSQASAVCDPQLDLFSLSDLMTKVFFWANSQKCTILWHN